MNTLKRTFSLFNRILKSRETIEFTSKVSCSTISKPEEEKHIIVEKVDDDLITKIAINRPQKRNALDKATAQYLAEAIDAFENDNKSLVAVLHGKGGNFCAGFDLHELAEYDGKTQDLIPHDGPLSIRCEKPVKKPMIASINGYAVGEGFELALMCDLRVIDDTAVMGFLNRRFGVPLLLGSTVRLPTIVGFGRAMDLILTGRSINAKDAFNWGLATKFVSAGSALDEALMLAKSLTKFPQKTLLADREALYHGTYSSDGWEEKMQFQRDNALYLVYEEGVSGAKRFQIGIGRHGNFKNLLNKSKDFKELDKELL